MYICYCPLRDPNWNKKYCIVRFHSQCYALIQQILIRIPAIFTSNVTNNIMLFGDEQFTGSLYSSLGANPVQQGMKLANNEARKWPILPFDVSRDFI